MSHTHPVIVWNDTMATGIGDIDSQHRYLIHALAAAREQLPHLDEPDKLEAITKDLLGYALFHFETEEALMADFGYAASSPEEAERHHREHREFSSQVLSVREALQEGHAVSGESVLDFLESWLVNHIMKTDQLLGVYLREKGVR